MIFPTLPTEFATQTDEGQVNVNVELAQGTRIEITDPVLRRIEDAHRSARARSDDDHRPGRRRRRQLPGRRRRASSRGNINILLTPKDERTRSSEQIAQDLRRQLAGHSRRGRPRERGGRQPGPQSPAVGRRQQRRRPALAGDPRRETSTSRRDSPRPLKELLDNTPGVADARLGRDEGRPELAVRVDRAKAALLGVSATTLANTIRTNVSGTQAALFRQGGKEYPIVVRLREDERQNVDRRRQRARQHGGRRRDAGEEPDAHRRRRRSDADSAQEPAAHQLRQRRTGNHAERSGQGRPGAAAAGHGQLPKDFSVGFGAEVEQQAEAFNQLRMVLILALVLVYAVMASQYESLRDPFIIMFSVPTAAIGVVLALKLTGTAFNMQAYIGIIMLAGIVVSNGILLVDYTNILRRRDGLPLREAVELAGRTRLRPILMTSIATALGLVPMSLGIGEGSELQVPLARVVIGGLTTSLLITLVLVPTVYTMFEEGLPALFKSKKAVAPRRGVSEKRAADTAGPGGDRRLGVRVLRLQQEGARPDGQHRRDHTRRRRRYRRRDGHPAGGHDGAGRHAGLGHACRPCMPISTRWSRRARSSLDWTLPSSKPRSNRRART